MVFPAPGTGIVGREETGNAVAVVQLSQIGRTGDDVVVRVVRIAAEAVALTQAGPRLRHDLHETDSALWRDGARIAEALGVHHGTYPGRRNAEALRGFGD